MRLVRHRDKVTLLRVLHAQAQVLGTGRAVAGLRQDSHAGRVRGGKAEGRETADAAERMRGVITANHCAARSARRCEGALEFWATCTEGMKGCSRNESPAFIRIQSAKGTATPLTSQGHSASSAARAFSAGERR